MSQRKLSQEFIDALFGEDDLGVVVRAHIHIESAVNALLDILIPIPSELPRLRYEQKLKLCCAMGMDKTLFPPLKELGDLRNSFGHNICTKLTNGACAKLLERVSKDDLESIAKSYRVTRENKNELPESFDELDPKSQLIGFVIWLNATLELMQDDACHRNDA